MVITRNLIIFYIIFLTLLGGFLRFTNLANNPPGLTVDEVSTGINAYSILKTGRDEYGNFLPISFKSLGDYKPPFYIYLTALSINFFGLNEFSVRLPSALIGTLTIPFVYFLFRELTKDKRIVIVGTTLFAISVWHIYYSRLALEPSVAMSLVVLGVLTFWKMIDSGKSSWAIGSALFFGLSVYTYHSERVFVPLLMLLLILLNRRKLFVKRLAPGLFLTTSAIIFSVLILNFFLGTDKTRAQMTLITYDADFLRSAASDVISKSDWFSNLLKVSLGNPVSLLIFFVFRKMISFFQPSFLFFQGLKMTDIGSFGLGVMYLFEIPFFIFGLIKTWQKKLPHQTFVLGWIFLGLIPAAITQDELHPHRTLVIVPMLTFISAVGAIYLFDLLRKRLPSDYFKFCLGISLLFIVWDLLRALLIFSVHFPTEKAEAFFYGTKQSVEYVLENKDKYQEIVYDPNRGVIGPDIVGVPHAYILFYSKYDPARYQNLPKYSDNKTFKFDKFTIRRIVWAQDRYKKNILFIGSPWSFPTQDLSQAKVLQKIYLPNGDLALEVVTVAD